MKIFVHRRLFIHRCAGILDTQQKPVSPKFCVGVDELLGIRKMSTNSQKVMRVSNQGPKVDVLNGVSSVSGDFKTFYEIQEICVRCEAFYVEKATPTEVEARFIAAFRSTNTQIDEVLPLYQEIQSFVHEYDYDAHHPGNGFRSFFTHSKNYHDNRCK